MEIIYFLYWLMKLPPIASTLFIPSLLLFVLAWLITLSSFTNSSSPPIQDVWVAPVSADSLKSPYPDEPLILTQGEELYLLYCASCHGEEGYGDGAAGGALGVQPADFHEEAVQKQSDGALFWKLSTGRGSMPPFGEVFSEEQKWQLIAFIRNLSSKTNIEQ